VKLKDAGTGFMCFTVITWNWKMQRQRFGCFTRPVCFFPARLARIRDHTHAVKASAIFVSPGQCLLTSRVSINT